MAHHPCRPFVSASDRSSPTYGGTAVAVATNRPTPPSENGGGRQWPQPTIGLDIGTNAVRAVEIELGDPPLIRRMGQVALPIGAVVDGEVADVGAVSIALRQLWTQAGFKSRQARVGMSSARMIVRTIEMPRVSHDELVSTIRLQLDDYVPLPAEETVFDIRLLDGVEPSSQTVQLLFAATHQDAVQPLLMAMHGADLKVAAVDVIPAALALALTRREPDEEDGVDIIVSIGAGTVVVVAARDGEPLFARTLTNAGGRRTTERIASRLGIGELDAERYKRLGATEDSASSVVLRANAESLDELIEEVRASLAFYGEQASAQHVRRLLATGGGSQIPELPARARRRSRTRRRVRKSLRPRPRRSHRVRTRRPSVPGAVHGGRARCRPRPDPPEGSATRSHPGCQARQPFAGGTADADRGRSGARSRRRRRTLHAGSQPDRRHAGPDDGGKRTSRRAADADRRANRCKWRDAVECGHGGESRGSGRQRRLEQHRLARSRECGRRGQHTARRGHLGLRRSAQPRRATLPQPRARRYQAS